MFTDWLQLQIKLGLSFNQYLEWELFHKKTKRIIWKGNDFKGYLRYKTIFYHEIVRDV